MRQCPKQYALKMLSNLGPERTLHVLIDLSRDFIGQDKSTLNVHAGFYLNALNVTRKELGIK